MNTNIYIIEGIDRIGKSTIIKEIINVKGFYNIVHYAKPQALDYYHNNLQEYQKDSFINYFKLWKSKSKIIFDRGHLGEYVYSQIYRDYSGNYVYDLEKQYNNSRIVLVLLITENFSICKDDGNSYNFMFKEKEQELFIEAFKLSGIKDKKIIKVNNNNNFKEKSVILKEILND